MPFVGLCPGINELGWGPSFHMAHFPIAERREKGTGIGTDLIENHVLKGPSLDLLTTPPLWLP